MPNGGVENFTNTTWQNVSGGGYNYLVKSQEGIIGYLGLSHIVDTIKGKTISIYYAVRSEYYGKGYGKLILNEISQILKLQNNVDIVIANVDNTNIYGLKTIEAAAFKRMEELSDEEETQFHKTIR